MGHEMGRAQGADMQHSRSLCGSLAARPGLRAGALIKMLISADQDCLDSALIKTPRDFKM